MVGGIPEHDLVVITGCPDTIRGDLETPDLTIGVGHHDAGLRVVAAVNLVDGTVTESNNHGRAVIAAVNSADHAIELPFLSAGHVVGVPELDHAVFTTSQHLVFADSLHSTDETLVGSHGVSGSSSFEAVDLSVGTTSEAASLGVESNARERSAGSGAEETSFFLAIAGPESNVLTSGSSETLGTGLTVESNIEDLVSGSLLHKLASAGLGIEAVNAVIVVEISGSNHAGTG